MTLLITGARGFIGSALAQFLSKNKSMKTVCLTTQDCDLTNAEKVYLLLETLRPDAIVHLVGGRMAEEALLKQSNLETTQNILEGICRLPGYAPRVVIPGSAAEYGQVPEKENGITEDVRPNPVSLYGRIKNQQTQLALSYADKGVAVFIARIFNIIGKGIPPELAPGRFARQIVAIERKEQEPVLHTWNLGGKRDFLDIEDVCRALLAIVEQGQGGEVYNVCSSRGILMRDLVDLMIQQSQASHIKIVEDTNKNQDSFDAVGSCQKLKTLCGWQPKVSLEESLQRTLQSYRA